MPGAPLTVRLKVVWAVAGVGVAESVTVAVIAETPDSVGVPLTCRSGRRDAGRRAGGAQEYGRGAAGGCRVKEVIGVSTVPVLSPGLVAASPAGTAVAGLGVGASVLVKSATLTSVSPPERVIDLVLSSRRGRGGALEGGATSRNRRCR